MCSRSGTIAAHDRRTDRQTDGQINGHTATAYPMLAYRISSRGKNQIEPFIRFAIVYTSDRMHVALRLHVERRAVIISRSKQTN